MWVRLAPVLIDSGEVALAMEAVRSRVALMFAVSGFRCQVIKYADCPR